MAIHTVLLLALGVGIFVGIKTKKLTVTELLVCGLFGLLLGGTIIGEGINGFVINLSGQLLPTVTDWLK